MMNVGLFTELTAHDLAVIAAHGVKRSYLKGTIVLSEGDESDCFYLINEGRVKVYASDDQGKEVILSLEGPREYFGELALIDRKPRSASVLTLEDTCLTVVCRSEFEKCLSEHPQLAFKMMRPLVDRIRFLTRNVKNLALLDVYGRVARTLLNLAREENGIGVIKQRLTHQDIANMVGASREMVSRIMKDLEVGGYIKIGKNRVIEIPGKLPQGY
ncbi:MAG: Crp/Fnr family transcriptional regulator [Gammaproteobacteria bacterium]